MSEQEGSHFTVVGAVAAADGRPYVMIEWGEMSGQLDIETTRAHAQLLLEAAQNAVSDAALYAFFTQEIKFTKERAAEMIAAVRIYRADQWGQPDLNMEFGKPAPEPD